MWSHTGERLQLRTPVPDTGATCQRPSRHTAVAYSSGLNCMVASIVTYRIPQGVLVDERFAGWQVIFCVPILHSW